MHKVEVTHLVERFEVLEEKYGLEIEGFRAEFSHYEGFDEGSIEILFDLTCPAGIQLPEGKTSLQFTMTVYNASGQVVCTEETRIDSDDFDGFDTISISSSNAPAAVEDVNKIRLRPSASRW